MQSRAVERWMFLLIAIIGLYSCSNEPSVTPPKKILSPEEAKQPLINTNKRIIKKEADMIDQYMLAHQLEMISTGTGLKYKILKKGTGVQPQKGQWAKVDYKITLLDGTVCYSSEKDGAKEFLIGMDHVESGLHEGVLYLHTGDKALFIIPSYLAHGLLGDDNKIPPLSPVVFEIELLSIR